MIMFDEDEAEINRIAREIEQLRLEWRAVRLVQKWEDEVAEDGVKNPLKPNGPVLERARRARQDCQWMLLSEDELDDLRDAERAAGIRTALLIALRTRLLSRRPTTRSTTASAKRWSTSPNSAARTSHIMSSARGVTSPT